MSRKNVKFPEIQKGVRVREAYSRTVCREAIRTSTGMDRWYAWVEKRSYGEDTRHLLLAYAFARGLPYSICEKKSERAPYPRVIVRVASEHGLVLDEYAVRAWVETRVELPQPAGLT